MTGLFELTQSVAVSPQGNALLRDPWLTATLVGADAITALAFFSIPITLVLWVRRRPEVAFGWLFWCFAAFILACGLSHLMSIVTLWHPLYGLAAAVKVVTAIASLFTAALLWPLLPKAVAMPSPAKLQAANTELAAMIAERDAALGELRTQENQREQAEAALMQAQKLEAVGQLTGGIAHDFNNLLQAVEGNLELIARKPDDSDKVVRWAGSALDAVERGRTLTGQLLAFSRKQRLNLKSVRLSELVTGMRDLIEKAVAPLCRVRIEPFDPTLNVTIDPLQLELAILNLSINARDAMPEGGTLTIRVEARSGDVSPDVPAGDYVALSIGDTGRGMSPEVRARAVEPFFTTKAPGEGTGMGLSMAFGVMRQSGGTLEIDSEQGKGTCITLLLRAASGEPPREEDDDDRFGPGPDLSGTSIVLIDDDEQVRSTLAEQLRQAGATVTEAADGDAGLALLEGAEPDLLIVDFAMPDLTGADVAHAARERHPELPVLVVTGFAESVKLDAVLGPGVSVLRKPFQRQTLLRQVYELAR